MIGCFYRIAKDDGKTACAGVAVAHDSVGLFAEIDQYCSPFAVEVAPINFGASCCMKVDSIDDGDGEIPEFSEYEHSDSLFQTVLDEDWMEPTVFFDEDERQYRIALPWEE